MPDDPTSGPAQAAREHDGVRNVIAIRTHYMTADLLDLARELAADDLYEVIFAVDERNATLDTAEFAKLSLTVKVITEFGLYVQDHMFMWGFGDYIFYLLREMRPEAPYLWLVENDVLINYGDRRTPFRTLDAMSQHDLLGTFVEKASPGWFWSQSVEGLFGDVYSCFFPMIRLSAPAADYLLQVRREQSPLYDRIERFQGRPLPNDEALVPSALVHGGFRIGDINQAGRLYTRETFGFYTLFNRYVPQQPDDLLYHSAMSGTAYAGKVVRHPGTDCARMLEAVSRDPDLSLDMIADHFFQHLQTELVPLADSPDRVLASDSIVSAILAYSTAPAVLDGVAGALARSLKPQCLDRLKRQHRSHFGDRPGPFPNIALGRPASQSSTCVWSHHQDARLDAAAANNGRLDVEFGCHTDSEDGPWWRVDLEAPSLVHGIRIQNRRQFEGRLNGFQIQSSTDDVTWTVIHAQAADKAAGLLIRIDMPGPVLARYLRLLVPGRTILHIVEFEAYGHPVGH